MNNYDGEPAPRCPVCGAEWDDRDHEPVQETRGWSAALNRPAWAWTCRACLDDEEVTP